MAFFFTRQASEQQEEEDLQCPICLDDYKDPKLLSCRHSLCNDCIEELVNSSRQKQSINCPLCRKTCHLPTGGAKKLPSSTKLVKLLKNAPSAKAKEEIKGAIDECVTGLSSIREIRKRVNRAYEQESLQIKRRINEVYERILEMIRQQKNQLYQEVDNYIQGQIASHPVTLLVDKADQLIQDINEVISQNEARSLLQDKDIFIQHLAEAKIAASKLSNEYEVKDIPKKTQTLDFQRNRSMMQCVSSSLFGNISFQNSTCRKTNTIDKTTKGLTYSLDVVRPGSRFRSLQTPPSVEAKFQPFAITGNSRGLIAVSCHGTHSVLLYKENGEFIQMIGRRGPEKGKLECPTGLAFIRPRILAIADGCLFGNPSRLQAFDSTGRFVRCLTQQTKNTHWLTRITQQENQLIIITCSHVAMEYESYVQVLNTDGSVALAFGATGPNKLLSPIKTVHLNKEYFVSDYDKTANSSMIKVFDEKGRYLRSFGECMLKRNIKDNPSYPLVIAVDPWRRLVLAYSGLFKVIRCYKPDGSMVSYHGTISGITDMFLTKERRLFAVCDGSSEFPHSVQVLFHT